MKHLKRTAEGFCYLNIGCGRHYSIEWNNVDLYIDANIVYHDIKRPLVYSDGTFDGVYCSHVLEHLSPQDGDKFVKEVHRVLKSGGIFRVVVPDLEMMCREYLRQLEAVSQDRNEKNLKRYHWVTLELIDQMVREKSGGFLLDKLKSGDYDQDFVKYRNGDLIEEFETCVAADSSRNFWKRLRNMTFGQFVDASKRRIKRVIWGDIVYSPQFSGEAHKWMYDRISLQLLLEKYRFRDFEITDFARSRIPNWNSYNLDRSMLGNHPRKPDSIYVEVIK